MTVDRTVADIIHLFKTYGPGCSKLTTSLVNVSLKFQLLLYKFDNIFFVEKM